MENKNIFSSEMQKNSVESNQNKFVSIKNKLKNYKLNNGEPLPFAVRKILKDIFILVLVSFLIFTSLKVYRFYMDINTNDDYEYFWISEEHKQKQSVNLSVNNFNNSADMVYDSISNWAGVENTVTADENFEHPKSMLEKLNKLLPNNSVTMVQGVKNSEYIETIYDNMKEGNPVIVMVGDPETQFLEYGLIKSITPAKNVIYAHFVDEQSKLLVLGSFVKMTRFENVEEKSFDLDLGLNLGIYSTNTAFIIGDKDDRAKSKFA